jgi:glycosyltransferase involved in cell wall biosynthesis
MNRLWDYPRLLRRLRTQFNVFHVVDHSYSQLVHELPRDRTVVTCHDLDAFRCVLSDGRENRSLAFKVMTRHIASGLSRAAHVVCVSHSVRNELVASGIVPANRVSTVANGIHPTCSRVPNPTDDSEAERLLQSNQGTTYLLHVGSTIPRKRIDTLLRVFATVNKNLPMTKLVRVGGNFTDSQQELARQLGILEAIVVLPFLEREILAAIYRRAALLLLTSEAEGFGLPLVEAMACGCPVIASDIHVLREIGGQAAVFCAVGDHSAWSETVISLLSERRQNPESWKKRSSDCSTHAAQFTWQRSAAQCVEIYKKVLDKV